MERFLIPVRNEATGEVRRVEVETGSVVDAQIEALNRLFRQEGWRRATALLPAPELMPA